MTVIEKIEAQQAKAAPYSPVWGVGEQLKDICRDEPRSAKLIEEDIDTVTIVEIEKKIRAFADKHKTGNSACVPPSVADGIIREAFGLPAREEKAAEPDDVDFDSFL